MRDLTKIKNASEALLNKAKEFEYNQKNFDAIEVYARKSESSSVLLKSGVVKQVNTENKLEIALRVVCDGNLGSAVSTSFDDDTLIERAVLSLKHQKSEPTIFPNESKTEVESVCEEVLACDLESHVKKVRLLNDRLLDIDSTLDLDVGSQIGVKDIYMCNSNGFSSGYSKTSVRQFLRTMTKQGFSGAATSKVSACFDSFSDAELNEFVNRHYLSETPVEFAGGKMPVIFSGNAMGSLMMRLLGGVNGGNINKEISPLVNKLGEDIFSNKLSVYDDGTLSFGVNTRAFDDEGTPSQRTRIVENGKLNSYLLTQGQAEKLSANLGKTFKPTGNATKRTFFSMEIEDAPSVSETNLIVDGDRIPDEKIISNIEYGVLITSVMGAHTGNIIAGEFSLNIGSGFLIENGELKGKVQGAMIAGNIYDFFNQIDCLGEKNEVMTGIFYPIGISPMVAFKEGNIVV